MAWHRVPSLRTEGSLGGLLGAVQYDPDSHLPTGRIRDEFFEIAIGIAKVAKNKDDFKRIFEEKNKERLAELEAFLSEGRRRSNRDIKQFPCQDAFVQTIRTCRDPYFSNLMNLLKGNAFGWEADMIWHEEPINKSAVDPNDDYQDPTMETQYIAYSDDEYSGEMEPAEYLPDEHFTLPKATNKRSPSSAQGKRLVKYFLYIVCHQI